MLTAQCATVTILVMNRIVPGPEVEVRLMHHVNSDYNPGFTLHRFRAEPIVLARPPSSLYSAPVALSCKICGDAVEYQVLSVLAARLRWGLWVALTVAGLTGIAVGFARVIRAGASDSAGPTVLLVGMFTVFAFGMFWVTEFGVSGTGTRFTFRPHGLRPQRKSDDRQTTT
jgi:hypothetical protein